MRHSRWGPEPDLLQENSDRRQHSFNFMQFLDDYQNTGPNFSIPWVPCYSTSTGQHLLTWPGCRAATRGMARDGTASRQQCFKLLVCWRQLVSGIDVLRQSRSQSWPGFPLKLSQPSRCGRCASLQLEGEGCRFKLVVRQTRFYTKTTPSNAVLARYVS